MNSKFIIVDTDCVELNVGSSVEVLKKKQGSGWVIEKKLLTMMELMSSKKSALSFDSLLELEVERPVWAGVSLSLLNENSAVAH
jgi:hypothetical protein